MKEVKAIIMHNEVFLKPNKKRIGAVTVVHCS